MSGGEYLMGTLAAYLFLLALVVTASWIENGKW